MGERGVDRGTRLLETGGYVMSGINRAEVAAKIQEIGMPEPEVAITVTADCVWEELRISVRIEPLR